MSGYEGRLRKKNTNRTASDATAQKRDAAESESLITDNRSQSAVQKKLQDIANDGPQASQLRSFHALANSGVMQPKALSRDKLNVVGESHPESGPRRAKEKEYAEAMTGGIYKTEGQFKVKSSVVANERFGDPMLLRVEMLLAMQKEKVLPTYLTPFSTGTTPAGMPATTPIGALWDVFKDMFRDQLVEIRSGLVQAVSEKAEKSQAEKAGNVYSGLNTLIGMLPTSTDADVGTTIIPALNGIIASYASDVLGLSDIRGEAAVSALRSSAMQGAAADNAARWVGKQKGVWKVGQAHVAEIASEKQGDGYELMTKDEFNADFAPWLLNNP